MSKQIAIIRQEPVPFLLGSDMLRALMKHIPEITEQEGVFCYRGIPIIETPFGRKRIRIKDAFPDLG